MPYLGNVPAENYAQVSYQDLTGGSGTSFTLDYPVGSAGEIEVFVNNVRQEPTVAYTVNGTALTMTGSVAATDDFYIVFQGKAEKSGTIPEKQTDGTYVFPDDVTVNGNITSTGIDDNADATALTIDSSENVLVGTTTRTNLSNGTGNTGHSLDNSGQARHTSDSSEVMFLNRLTDDGDITVFRKDGTTVGSIVARSGDLAIGTGNTGLRFSDGDRNIYPFDSTVPNEPPAVISLGDSGSTFKDLYLSGGVYLGGVVAANKLDDYEEGTWTPAVTSGTINSVNPKYTKIGNLVHISTLIQFFSDRTSSNAITLTGLPFTAGSSYATQSTMQRYVNSGGDNVQIYITSGSAAANFYGTINNTAYNIVLHNDLTGAAALFYISLTYQTA